MDTKKTVIKTEEFPRLQSLRLPRDLSLGGTKPKKVYAPNVNVVRNKDKSKYVIKKQEETKKGKKFLERKNIGSLNNSKFVRSAGLFSEGKIRRPQIHSEGGRYHSRGNQEERPAINLPVYGKASWNVDKKVEDVILEDIIHYDEYESSDEEKCTLLPILWNKPQSSNVKIKTEKLNGSIKNFSITDISEFSKSFFDRTLCTDDNPSLSLFKLPDSLAGKGLSDDPAVKTIFDYPLDVMLEGRIGTLQIRKSGKMSMKIGNSTYCIDSTKCSGQTEDIAVISDEDKPMVSTLGAVQHRFIINPDWSKLLN